MGAFFAEINEYNTMGLFLSLAMGAILVGSLFHYITRRAKCRVEVEAYVDDVVKVRKGRGRLYKPVYRWCYEGKEYQKTGFGFAHNIYGKLTTVTIRIDPEQPDDFFDPLTWKKNMMWVIPVTVLLMICSLTAG